MGVSGNQPHETHFYKFYVENVLERLLWYVALYSLWELFFLFLEFLKSHSLQGPRAVEDVKLLLPLEAQSVCPQPLPALPSGCSGNGELCLQEPRRTVGMEGLASEQVLRQNKCFSEKALPDSESGPSKGPRV